MSDLSQTPKISGIPNHSRAGRRLKARTDGRSEQLAPRLYRLPALVISWIVANVGAVLHAGCMIGLGFFVTKVVLTSGTISRADDRFPNWLAGQRTPSRTDWSYVGSMIGDTPVIVSVVGLVALALVLRRRWRMASFVVQAILAEVLVYGITVRFIERDRPPVPRLDHYSPTHSFPSGHTAAAVAVYGSIALLLAAHFKARPLRVAIWSVAIALPLIVALARMYRGMHHPIDVTAGALMGVAALLIAMFAARTSRAAAEVRAGRRLETFS